MLVRRFAEASAYQAPNHHGCSSLSLTDWEEGGPQTMSVGLSHFLPGGGAGPDSAPFERVYVVISGKLTIDSGSEQTVLFARDTVFIPAGEVRHIRNDGNEVVSMIVVRQVPARH